MQGFEAGNFIKGQFGEKAQEAADITIFGVAPELPEIPDRQFVFVEPNRTLGGFAHLRAGRGGDQRRGQAKDFLAIDAPCQINPRDDIAPLIGAAHLQHTAIAAAQFHKVVSLQNGIVEFQKTHRLFAIKPQFHAIHGEHTVDRKMHAVIAQKRNIFELIEPFRVIDHDGIARAIAEFKVFFKNLTNAVFILLNIMIRKQRPLGVFARWIADFCGAAAHQDDRLMARLLQDAEHHDLHERADMQTIGGAVKANVSRKASFPSGGIQAFKIGRLMHIAAFGDDAKEI